MSEEVKIKISQPMFEVVELERFDNNIHNIIEEYSKLMFKEKDQILTQRIIMKQEEEIKRLKEEYVMLQNASDEVEEEKDREIERLNNIINEIIECIDSLYVPYEMEENWVFYGKEYDDREKVIEKIKELKGVDKE